MTVSTQRPSAVEIDEMIKTLERILPQLKNYAASLEDEHEEQDRNDPRHQSYVQLAIAVLEEIGKPTPITVLLERIRERRNDPTIKRGSVETSLLRHISMKGENTAVVKACPGTYVLRQHVASCG